VSRRVFYLAAAIVGVLLPAISVEASAFSGNGLVVSPAVEQLNVVAGQEQLVFNAEITNDSRNAVTIAVRMDDFTALNTSGNVSFLNNSTGQATQHGLAHWMDVQASLFNLAPGASQVVPVTINNIATMAAGGHYGAVIFGTLPTGSAATRSNAVAAREEVSVLVFLTTATNGTQSIKLLPPSIPSFEITLPAASDVVFTNTGDTQTVPRGVITLDDATGHEVARGIINTDSGLVLPETERLYEVPLRSEAQWLWPGKYQMSIYYRAGSAGKIYVYSASFWYIGQAIVAVFGVLAAIGIVAGMRRLSRTFIRYGRSRLS
jgi:hypothetical protein